MRRFVVIGLVVACLSLLFFISEALTNHDLSHLSGVSALEILMLIGCRNVDTSLAGLKELTKLRQLELCAVELTDHALSNLAQIRSLELLIFNEMSMSEEEFITHLTPLPVPRIFLGDCYNLTDITLERIAETYHDAPKPLVELRLYDTPVSIEALESFLKLVPRENFEVLGFPGMPVTDGTLAQLGGMTNLVELDLSGTQITDVGVKHLESLTGLEHLHLAGTQLTDKCLESLTQFKRLRTVVVEGTGISEAGVAEIQNARPACEILPDEDW